MVGRRWENINLRWELIRYGLIRYIIRIGIESIIINIIVRIKENIKNIKEYGEIII